MPVYSGNIPKRRQNPSPGGSAGDVQFTMIFSICSMWLCRVILAIVLVRVFHMGLLAVWIAMFIDWVLLLTKRTNRARRSSNSRHRT